MMRFKILKKIDELKAIAIKWNELLACCSASHVPFLREEYLSTWWGTLGGGEWKSGELLIVIACDQNDQLVGIAPLFFTENRNREPALMLLGSIEISDYLDLIVRTDVIEEFMRGLLATLDSKEIPNWRVLDWYNIPEQSPTLAALKTCASEKGWRYIDERLEPCPQIQLPGDWEAYLAGIDKKQRHEIRRKMRRAEEADTPTRWYIVDDASQLETAMDEFLDLMAQDPDKERFLTGMMRQQMHETAKVAFQNGWLQLAFLEAGEKKVAGYMNFDYAGHVWVYNSGLDFGNRELSPGWVLLGQLLKWANENKRTSFDFMRGDEDYKYRFGGVNRYIARAIVQR